MTGNDSLRHLKPWCNHGVNQGEKLMPRAYKRLTDRRIASTKTAARLADGEGLYLIVQNESSKHWVFEYQFKGTRRYMGLGSARDVSLAEARDEVAEYRKLKTK